MRVAQRRVRGLAVFVLFALMSALFLVTRTLDAAQSRTSAIATFSARSSTVDRFVQEALLVERGGPADPTAILADLRETVRVFLDGGELSSLQGSAHNLVGVRPVDEELRPRFAEYDRLLRALEGMDHQVPGAALSDTQVQALRTQAALIRSVGRDVVGELTIAADQQLERQLALIMVLSGLALTGAGTAMARERRFGQQRAAQRFEAIVRDGADWITIVDAKGRISFSTPASEGLVGVGPDRVVGRRLQDFLTAGAPEFVEGLRHVGENGESLHLVLDRVSPAGAARTAVEITDRREAPEIGGFVVVARDDTQPELLRRRLADEIHRDPLTGLGNRIDSVRELTVRLAATSRGEPAPMVLVVDVDGFADLAIAHGEEVGDALIRRMADVLRSWAPGDTHVARTGDDEFTALLVPAGRSPGEEAERLHARLAGTVTVLGHRLSLRVSVVALQSVTTERDAGSLLQQASLALRQVKLAGGNAPSGASPALAPAPSTTMVD